MIAVDFFVSGLGGIQLGAGYWKDVDCGEREKKLPITIFA